MAELYFTVVGSADRFRLGNDAQRIRDEQRDSRATLNNTRYAEVQRRDEIAAEDIRRRENAIRLRRNDIEAEIEKGITLREQQLDADRIADDAAFRRLRDDLTTELRDIRADREFEEGRILSEFDEGLALRQQEDRDFQVQEQIDLRLADDNVREVTPDSGLPRGSIVDVFG